MRICIIGAGAIGGLIAVRLAASGHELTVVERGDRLDAIRQHGLRLLAPDAPEVKVHPRALAEVPATGDQDLVVLAVKAHQLAEVAPRVAPALAPDGLILTTQNGIPWWYFMGRAGELAGRRLGNVDPGGVIADSLPVERVIGSVVYPAAETLDRGGVRLIEGNRFCLSEIHDQRTPRVEAIAQVFTQAGFKAPVIDDIRSEIWLKLWGNMSFNPISALTGATLAGICRHPFGRALAAQMMREAQAIAEALGVRFRVPLEKRIAGAEAVGEHKTSMLQDVEAGRLTEIDALLGAVLELGRLVSLPTPASEAVYACVKLLEDTRQIGSGTRAATP